MILYSSPSASILIISIFLFTFFIIDWIETTATRQPSVVGSESNREQEVLFPRNKTGTNVPAPVKSETALETCLDIDKPASLRVVSEIGVGSNVNISAVYFSTKYFSNWQFVPIPMETITGLIFGISFKSTYHAPYWSPIKVIFLLVWSLSREIHGSNLSSSLIPR